MNVPVVNELAVIIFVFMVFATVRVFPTVKLVATAALHVANPVVVMDDT
jgi:hypothetical protein